VAAEQPFLDARTTEYLFAVPVVSGIAQFRLRRYETPSGDSERGAPDQISLICEYPRDAGKGEQMDFVEAMELDDAGLIQRHCVCWGWFGFRVLQCNE
jgi:hypothetical protein